MRILHTGDWHLGRTLLGADLLEHQAAFADWLVETVRSRAVDLVVIAGDVYDRAIPPVDAVRILSRTLERLAGTATVVLTPGNHDSAPRLGFGAGVMGERVRILAEPAGIGTPVLLDDPDGPVAVYGIPYLHPDLTRYALADLPDEPLARSHHAVLGAAMQRVRADLADRPGTRSVVVAHAFVGGAEPSDSEQDIRVGGVDQAPASVFDGVDYVALGHLHGPQRVGDGDRIRYAGSPLAFSFGERHQRKSVTLVELDAAGAVTVELVPTPVPRRLVDVRGSNRRDRVGRVRGRRRRVGPGRRHRHGAPRAHVRPGEGPLPARAGRHPRTRRPARADRSPSGLGDVRPVEVTADFVAFATGAAPDDDDRAILTEAYEAAALALQQAGDR